MTQWKTVPAKQRPGRSDPRYLAAVKTIAQKARDNDERCWFYNFGMCKYDGAAFDWSPERGPLGFTAHHVHRVMDGGQAVVDSEQLVPAHRGCNSADGLRAQNARRAARKRGEEYDPEEQVITEMLASGLSPVVPMVDHTSRNW